MQRDNKMAGVGRGGVGLGWVGLGGLGLGGWVVLGLGWGLGGGGHEVD